MTCIVALRDADGGVWMGGDRAAVANRHHVLTVADPKVFRNGPYLIGYTSSFRMGQLLEHGGGLPEPDPGRPLMQFMATEFIEAVRSRLKAGGYVTTRDGREESGTFLVGVAGLLFVCDDDFSVHRPACGFAAVGSGMSVAQGSLHATGRLGQSSQDRLRLALEVASEFVTTVRPPFDVLHLPPLQSTTLERAS